MPVKNALRETFFLSSTIAALQLYVHSSMQKGIVLTGIEEATASFRDDIKKILHIFPVAQSQANKLIEKILARDDLRDIQASTCCPARVLWHTSARHICQYTCRPTLRC